MATVTVRDVVKKYGELKVIHGINLSIAEGSFVVLLGPSGCGKSTLLRMIAGLEPISEGDVLIGDRVVNDVHPKDRNIAMVFQNYALYAHMTVRENMSFALDLRKAPKDEIERKIAWAASILNLEPYLDRYPKQLSGGQRQRVAMGRAIVRNPEVFLFDEPLSNLDAKLRVQMRTEIKELHQRLKTTTIYVTHDQIEAMTMADKIVIMRNGYIEQAGSPLEVYDNPDNLFVAEFIGSPSMNLIEGRVEGGRFVSKGGTAIALPAGCKAGEGQAVVLGIRPEHTHPDPAGALEARVGVVEPTGPETHIYFELDGRDICAVTRERTGVKPGDPIRLRLDADRIHLFDQASGKAIR
ncbi:ABC transporter ATP-binding protein [Gellertiella hungarica]|uniref:Multiple sugar transport system ATP-binding protein n=1 Tax=Gellertiella hungarica TaxID=1572859 RepID=A0A7W6J2S3_9HYPH|nr:sn-glycerol-3-phosphate ABC transporter ATP-binding protein UgpC [Gellertiella hungarica]MBB4063716.1 multiple sugar transport system ATP-binding protein [Gellertiella hungarica]